jgi:hypothetical protein
VGEEGKNTMGGRSSLYGTTGLGLGNRRRGGYSRLSRGQLRKPAAKDGLPGMGSAESGLEPRVDEIERDGGTGTAGRGGDDWAGSGWVGSTGSTVHE